jgi:hypothetical protein
MMAVGIRSGQRWAQDEVIPRLIRRAQEIENDPGVLNP